MNNNQALVANKIYKPVVLMILDGWGLSPSWGGNALAINNPKNIDRLWREHPHCILQALSVISQNEPVCDSRLGHMMIGAGRPVRTNLTKINTEIKNNRFFKNEVLLGAINWAKKNNSNLHLIGLASDGGVHSHVNHLLALLELAFRNNFNRVCIDIITDGTDTDSTDALRYIEKIQNKIKELKLGVFTSIGGRRFAMDREGHWDLVYKYYDTITNNKGIVYSNIREAITTNYRQGLNDEYIEPGLIRQSNGSTIPIKENDAVILYNFREDRAREITQAFIAPKNQGLFGTRKINNLYLATFISYQKNLPTRVAFPSDYYTNTLSEVISSVNKRQLKLAESEKYAHVTYFLNGGKEEPFPGEERKILASPNVDSYDKAPAMSAQQIADQVYRAIKSKAYDFIAINFANVDVVAHTGNILAVGQAVQVLDKIVGEITQVNLENGGATIITADHGNAEQMVNLNQANQGDRKTYHTTNPVPFILATPDNRKDLLASSIAHNYNALSEIITAKNTLADVAPTILQLMQIPKPQEMLGHSLLSNLE